MDKKRIGKKLKALRGSQKSKDVAKYIGITPSSLSMYEKGERMPRDEIKVKLAEYYNQSVAEIFFN